MSIADRLYKGEEITLNRSKLTACIGAYTVNEKQIPYELVATLEDSGFIECDSGNFETGDRHYVLSHSITDVQAANAEQERRNKEYFESKLENYH